MRNYSFDLIDMLAKSSHKETCYGAPIIIKDIPEGQSSGVLDPRELELAKKTLAERTSRPTTLQAIRESAGYNNEAINDKEVITEIVDLTDNEHRFSVYTNVLKELKDEILPVIIYAHGGSFFTLSAKKTQNFAKSLAEIAKCRVYNVEYGLAPECPFPIGVNQFEATYLFVKEHANELKINPQKIIVMGDSSGGNFASQIANKYYKDIYMQILYYRLCLADNFFLYVLLYHFGQINSQNKF